MRLVHATTAEAACARVFLKPEMATRTADMLKIKLREVCTARIYAYGASVNAYGASIPDREYPELIGFVVKFISAELATVHCITLTGSTPTLWALAT